MDLHVDGGLATTLRPIETGREWTASRRGGVSPKKVTFPFTFPFAACSASRSSCAHTRCGNGNGDKRTRPEEEDDDVERIAERIAYEDALENSRLTILCNGPGADYSRRSDSDSRRTPQPSDKVCLTVHYMVLGVWGYGGMTSGLSGSEVNYRFSSLTCTCFSLTCAFR